MVHRGAVGARTGRLTRGSPTDVPGAAVPHPPRAARETAAGASVTRLRPRPARTAVAGLAAVAALALGGCSATNDMTTVADYDASDGAGAALGNLRIGNLLVVAAAEGDPGVVAGSLSNGGSRAEQVTLEVDGGEPVEVEVPAGGTVLMGAADAPARYGTADVEVAAVAAPPGGLVDVTITTGSAGTQELRVPVLDGTLPEYEDLLPEG